MDERSRRAMDTRTKDGTVVDQGDVVEIQRPDEPPWRAKVERVADRGLRVYPVGHPGSVVWISWEDVPRDVTYVDSPDDGE